MKIFFLLFILPLASFGQTAHVEDEEVKYSGKTALTGMSATDIYNRAVVILPELLKSADVQSGQEGKSITARVETRLPTPYQQIRKVFFTFHFTAMDGGYEYKVDSVSVMDQRRGGRQHVRTSKEILDSIEEGGATVILAETILNQFDMKIHEVLARLENRIQEGK